MVCFTMIPCSEPKHHVRNVGRDGFGLNSISSLPTANYRHSVSHTPRLCLFTPPTVVFLLLLSSPSFSMTYSVGRSTQQIFNSETALPVPGHRSYSTTCVSALGLHPLLPHRTVTNVFYSFKSLPHMLILMDWYTMLVINLLINLK